MRGLEIDVRLHLALTTVAAVLKRPRTRHHSDAGPRARRSFRRLTADQPSHQNCEQRAMNEEPGVAL